MTLVPPFPREVQSTRVREDFQTDFSGGDASATTSIYLRANQLARLHNAMLRRGGGLTARRGYKDVGAHGGGAGRNIFELETTIPTVLTFVAAGPSWYEEQMQPRYRWFDQTPGTADAVYIGAREKFNQLVTNMLYAYVVPGNTFVWEISNGLGGWIDKTAQITGTIANSLQMQGAAGEWVFTWPDFADWLPQQVETRLYQYWLRVRCTLGGTNGGSDVVHGQRLVKGDMLGRRLIVTAGETSLNSWPGFSVARVNIEAYSPTRRVRGAMFNDYFYFASDGLRQLRRWNLALGVTRAGGNNNPVDAGLLPPPALAGGDLVNALNANGYPPASVLRYRTSYLYGPEGRLGESPPGASAILTTGAAAEQVTVNLATEIATAATRDVHAILLYVTDDLTNTPPALRDDISGFYLIRTILRDDATWNAGVYVDVNTPKTKTEPTPITYVNVPPFKPKYVAKGGERLWIADDFRVAWSDIGRGDSWDPRNTKTFFPNIKGIVYRDDRLLVAHEEDWSFVQVPPTGLPLSDFFYRGLGCVQPDSITIGDGEIFFMSRLGPAVIRRGDQVRRIGQKRVWEAITFWNSKAGERAFAMGAYHEPVRRRHGRLRQRRRGWGLEPFLVQRVRDSVPGVGRAEGDPRAARPRARARAHPRWVPGQERHCGHREPADPRLRHLGQVVRVRGGRREDQRGDLVAVHRARRAPYLEIVPERARTLQAAGGRRVLHDHQPSRGHQPARLGPACD
jgi:hypothetical protein